MVPPGLVRGSLTHNTSYSSKTCPKSFDSSDPIQINGIKLLGNASEASMKHLKAMERRALKLWGEATGKTIPLRMKKICMYNVSNFWRFIVLKSRLHSLEFEVSWML